MAKVLAAIPAHGLEAVLDSAKQLLDSGVTSLEQVLNVLSRLNDIPIPAPSPSYLVTLRLKIELPTIFCFYHVHLVFECG